MQTNNNMPDLRDNNIPSGTIMRKCLNNDSLKAWTGNDNGQMETIYG